MTDLTLFPKPPKGLSLPTKPVRVIGIDLGTTNSTVAEIVWEPGKTVLPKVRCIEVDQETEAGRYTHTLVPSVVAVGPSGVLVGEGAKRLRPRAGELGLELYRDIFWECKNLMGVKRTFQKAPPGLRSAREVAGHVLKFLLDAARAESDLPISRAVVTVPASFQTAQRKDTIEAARLAGIDLSGGDLLDEPVAAFLDYLASHGSELGMHQKGPQKLAVFDFGGGTCDVAILHLDFRDGVLAAAPLAVSRYHRLGGGDIDAAIVDEVFLPQILKQNGLEPWDLRFEDKVRSVFPAYLGVAEALKIGLCTEISRLQEFGKYDPATTVKRLPAIHPCTLRDGRSLALKNPALSAADFTRLMGTFLDKDFLFPRETEYRSACSLFAPLQDALERSGLRADQVDLCLLAGGSSLIPQVAPAVAGFFPKAKVLPFEGEAAVQTAVARGAALHALALEVYKSRLVKGVTSDSISIQTSSGPETLVPRAAALPFPEGGGWMENRSLRVPAGTPGDPMKLRIELRGSQGRVVGTEFLHGKSWLPKGTPLPLSFRMDENQDFHLVLRAGEGTGDEGRAFDFENPLVHVTNPNPRRERLEFLEEKLRTESMPPEEQLSFAGEAAGLCGELGMRERAMNLYQKILGTRKEPDPILLNRMGMLAEEMRDWELAQKCYRQSSEVGHWGGALFNLALSQRRRGLLREAAHTMEEAIDLGKEASYLVLKASIAGALGDEAVKRESLSEALAQFSPVMLLSDWELGWFLTAAEMKGDGTLATAARAEQDRRKIPAAEREEGGVLPDRLAGLALRKDL